MPGMEERGDPHHFVEPRTTAAFLKAFDGGEGAQLRKPDALHPVLLGEALTGVRTRAVRTKGRRHASAHDLREPWPVPRPEPAAVNGATWTRQRSAVLAAAGGGISQQQARHAKAARLAAEFVLSVPTGVDDDSGAVCVPDASLFGRIVAARGLVAAVVGCEEAGEGHCALPASLQVPAKSPCCAVPPTCDLGRRRTSTLHPSRQLVVLSRHNSVTEDQRHTVKPEHVLPLTLPAAGAATPASDPVAREGIETALMEHRRSVRQPHHMRDSQAIARTAQSLRSAVDAAAQRFLESDPGQDGPADGAAAIEAALPAAGTQTSAEGKEGAGGGGGGRGAPEGSGILPRLLAQPSLSVAEAVCNALSSLLAGTDTTGLLLAVSLMHLAERPELQASTGASSRAAPRRSRWQPCGERPGSAVQGERALAGRERWRVDPPACLPCAGCHPGAAARSRPGGSGQGRSRGRPAAAARRHVRAGHGGHARGPARVPARTDHQAFRDAARWGGCAQGPGGKRSGSAAPCSRGGGGPCERARSVAA
jgi:hypothetical protein